MGKLSKIILAVLVLLTFGCEPKTCYRISSKINGETELLNIDKNLSVRAFIQDFSSFTRFSCVLEGWTYYQVPLATKVCLLGQCNGSFDNVAYLDVWSEDWFLLRSMKSFLCKVSYPPQIIWDDHPSEPAPIGITPEIPLIRKEIGVLPVRIGTDCSSFCNSVEHTNDGDICTSWY